MAALQQPTCRSCSCSSSSTGASTSFARRPAAAAIGFASFAACWVSAATPPALLVEFASSPRESWVVKSSRNGAVNSAIGWISTTVSPASLLIASASPRESWVVKSSRNGAANSSARSSMAEMPSSVVAPELEGIGGGGGVEQFGREDEDEQWGIGSVGLAEAPSCPLPSFPTSGSRVTLFNPLCWLPDSVRRANEDERPLLLYVPGMDGTGQGIRSQLTHLVEAGYDVRCVYIPSSDRSSWKQLVDLVLPLVVEEVEGVDGKSRHLTVLGESFGGGLALRLAKAAPSVVTRLVLINSATHFPKNNLVGSLIAQTGLLSIFSQPLYEIAQDILLPLLVKRNRVSAVGTENFLSPVDFVPAACAAYRLSMLNDDSGLADEDLSAVTMPTLLIVSAKDRVMASMNEGALLKRLLPNSKRIVLPESGHTALCEDSVNIADMLLANGFTHPVGSRSSQPLSLPITPLNPVTKRGEAVADDVMDEMGLILGPWRILTSPLISGADNLPMQPSEPRRPLLFVGNHTMFGIYDSPLLFYELYLRGFRCRGLAHPGHWVTGVGPIFERYGHVKATKRAAYKLLKEGENVLLFPGGAREVCKRKGEEYKLLWKETADFVRMATRHKAIIVPFGALGGDEAYDILYDANELRTTPLWPLVKNAYNRVELDIDNVYPITAFPGTKLPSPFPIPSIERIYFHIAEPIDTSKYSGSINDREEVQSLYELVKARVEGSIELLKDIRSKDPERELPVRLLAKLGRLLPEFLPRMPSR